MRTILIRYIFFTTLLFCAQIAGAQQSIEVLPEKKTMLLGEPLSVTIKITGGKEYQAIIPDSLGKFEVLDRGPLKTTNAAGHTTTSQEIIITSFDSGQLRLPPLAVEGNTAFVSAGVDVLVNTVPADSTRQYGDIKQIINLEPPMQWPYMIGLLAVVLLSAFAIWRLNQKLAFEGRLQETFENAETPATHSSLLEQLEQLREQWLRQQTTPLALGNTLMEIFRRYLAGRGINVRSKTGEEMIVLTKERYDAATWQGIAQTVRLCNAMRFGKYQANSQEGVDGIEGFKRAVTP